MASKLVVYVALLRGINVGGHTAVSMVELKACFENLGYQHVQAYINSGNVIFRSNLTNPRAIEVIIEQALTAIFGLQIVVVVRSFSDIEQLMRHLPASWQTPIDQKCNVIFLRHSIDTPEILKDLKPKPAIEELYYSPGVLFWSAKTSDLTKSNMIKLSRSAMYKAMTVRNLNTTHKIYELMALASKQS